VAVLSIREFAVDGEREVLSLRDRPCHRRQMQHPFHGLHGGSLVDSRDGYNVGQWAWSSTDGDLIEYEEKE